MTGSCWEWYKIHFYTKILDINIMLTFSTSEDTKSLKIANVREIAIAYTIRKSLTQKSQKFKFEFKIFSLKDDELRCYEHIRHIREQF
jgi:hypothetical protein